MKIPISATVSMITLRNALQVSAFQTPRPNLLQRFAVQEPTPTLSTLSLSMSSSGSDNSGLAISWQSLEKCWRPVVSDVERISWGKPAKKKGTGSRGVPHRLNSDERLLFDNARRKGFLEVGGSGWRSQRREAPLINSYRSLCDARAQACIVLHKGNTGVDELVVVVDLSPLRLPDIFGSVERDLVDFVGLPTSYSPTDETKQMDESSDEGMDDTDFEVDETDFDLERYSKEDDSWDNRPIYQLPTYCVVFEVQRAEGKALGKKLGSEFRTIEANVSKSKKPKHVKSGKNRRSGGYGIG